MMFHFHSFLFIFNILQAKGMKVNIISEDDLLNMIATRPAGKGLPSPAGKKSGSQTPRGKARVKEETPEVTIKKEKVSPVKKEPEPTIKKEKISPVKKEHIKKTEEPLTKTSASQSVTKNGDSEVATLPWVEKYKPLAASKIIGT